MERLLQPSARGEGESRTGQRENSSCSVASTGPQGSHREYGSWRGLSELGLEGWTLYAHTNQSADAIGWRLPTPMTWASSPFQRRVIPRESRDLTTFPEAEEMESFSPKGGIWVAQSSFPSNDSHPSLSHLCHHLPSGQKLPHVPTLGWEAEHDLQSPQMETIQFIPTHSTDKKTVAWNGVSTWSPASRRVRGP